MEATEQAETIRWRLGDKFKVKHGNQVKYTVGVIDVKQGMVGTVEGDTPRVFSVNEITHKGTLEDEKYFEFLKNIVTKYPVEDSRCSSAMNALWHVIDEDAGMLPWVKPEDYKRWRDSLIKQRSMLQMVGLHMKHIQYMYDEACSEADMLSASLQKTFITGEIVKPNFMPGAKNENDGDSDNGKSDERRGQEHPDSDAEEEAQEQADNSTH